MVMKIDEILQIGENIVLLINMGFPFGPDIKMIP
jgi:hypothetical protein